MLVLFRALTDLKVLLSRVSLSVVVGCQEASKYRMWTDRIEFCQLSASQLWRSYDFSFSSFT